MDALETEFVRMAAKTVTPTIDQAWAKYEKVKALAVGRGTTTPEQRLALKTALVVLINCLFTEESSYVL